ncbi:hypothetical protein PN462_06260 [Spirulina sp. CS-785/01]|uniref:hypothetical protein n=1 Tax=Spirulina sp. CS-785/01 TaxID=3021716 RepID=UPI00232ADD52|nr:hypothetical protein [Spirulina sp. CS-785/01]MDB9312697.1 hypothetical protein [Spirulina sp. CS-785/01]
MNQNAQETRLQQLIETVQQQPRRSLQWRKAINQLLLEVQQLPKLAKSTHPDYEEVLDDVLLRFAEEIKNFQPQHQSITASLTAWINGKLRLKYAVRDLQHPYRNRSQGTPTAKTEFRQQTRKPPLSLDTPISEKGGETFSDRIPANLETVQAQIQADQAQQTEQIGRKLKTYIQQDPDNRLKTCHPKAHPRCNCQVLSQRLLLKHPPDKLVAIAQDYQIKYHTLNWHWKNKALPLLQSIALEFGYHTSGDS